MHWSCICLYYPIELKWNLFVPVMGKAGFPGATVGWVGHELPNRGTLLARYRACLNSMGNSSVEIRLSFLNNENYLS